MNILEIITPDVLFLFGYTLLLIFTCIVIGLMIWRRYFGLKSVNCWFCNTDSEVDDDQAWICGSCEQYNGFNEDGDYTDKVKVLQQKDHYRNIQNQSADTQAKKSKSSSSFSPSKLCNKCAGNQLLKINQLAAFVPIYEDNFDVEIEQFKKRLEILYSLCNRCNKFASSHIQHQDKILGEKVANIRANLPDKCIVSTPTDKNFKSSILSFNFQRYFFMSCFIAISVGFYRLWRHKDIIFSFRNISSAISFIDQAVTTISKQIPSNATSVISNQDTFKFIALCCVFAFASIVLYFVCFKTRKVQKHSPNFKLKKQEKFSPKFDTGTAFRKPEIFSDSEMEVDEESDEDKPQAKNLNDSMSLLGFGAKKTKPASFLPTPPPSNQSSVVSSQFENRMSSTLKHLPSDRNLPFRRYASTMNTSNNLMNSMSFTATRGIGQPTRSFVSPAKLNLRTAKSFERKNTAYVHSTKSECGLWSRGNQKLNNINSSRSVMTSPYSRTAQWLHRTNNDLNTSDVAEEANSSWSCSWENKSDVSVNDSASQLVTNEIPFTPRTKAFVSPESSPRSIFSSVSMRSVKEAEQSRLCCWLLVFCLLLNLILIAMLYYQIKGMQLSQKVASSKWGS